MGLLLRLRNIFLAKNYKGKIIWLGLDNAGKTTIIRRLTSGIFESKLSRTMGLNVDEFTFKFESDESLELMSWDLGGQTYFRTSLWKAYMEDAHGIVFVIDASDTNRLDEAGRELWRYVLDLPSESMKNVPILILANKQDLSGAVNPTLLAKSLNLHKVTHNSFTLIPVSAETGLNLQKALNWLVDHILISIR